MSPAARNALIAAVALLAAAAGFMVAKSGQRLDMPGNSPNSAPDSRSGNTELATAQLLALTLPDTRAVNQPLSQWKGKLLVVNFWATWCTPCREEMPGFSRLQAKYAAKGVQFVGIAFDTADKVKEFAGQTPVTYPLLIGSSALLQITAELGNAAGGLPFTLIVGRNGKLFQSRLGIWKESVLDAILADQTQ